jgi:activating signal cointegrator 1
MKAISIWQPWASLIAIGAKKYETRSWETSYRGPIAIHAASIQMKTVMANVFPLGKWTYAPDYEAKRSFLKKIKEVFSDYSPIEDIESFLDELPTGCVIATAELVACHKIVLYGGRGISSTDPGWIETESGIYEPSENEAAFGNWACGRYAWELSNVKRIDIPIQAKGKQRIWECEALDKVV